MGTILNVFTARFSRKSHFSDCAHVQDLRIINVDTFNSTRYICHILHYSQAWIYIFDYNIIYNSTKYIHLQEIYGYCETKFRSHVEREFSRVIEPDSAIFLFYKNTLIGAIDVHYYPQGLLTFTTGHGVFPEITAVKNLAFALSWTVIHLSCSLWTIESMKATET